VDPSIAQVQSGKSYTVNNIQFETNSSELKQASKAELDNLVYYLNLNPFISLEVGGHTDNVGDDAANMSLSSSRAKAVKDYLIEKGIEAARVSSKGYGETKPIATNGTEEGRAQNRRTEVIIR
jgi:outer membrane protein OmpA-like peptidoglycan-associated protein